jgi:molecular chaperone DnaK
VHVSAKDKGTGKENKITIQANSGLTEAEIQRMVKDAEANAEEDHRMAELAMARNSADALVHATRKSLTEYGDKLAAEEKTAIEAAITEVEEALKNGADKAAIDTKVEALSAASQKLGEKMYADAQAAQAAAQGGAGPEGGAKPTDDNVVDAEFKEVKRDQK